MTLRNRCIACDHVIEAPADRRGKEVVCPRCAAANVMRSSADLGGTGDDERERRRFLAGISRAGQPAQPASYDVPIDAGAAAAGEALDRPGRAMLATHRLKDISVYLLAAAYLLLFMALGLGVALGAGAGLPGAWSAFAFLAGTFLGVLAFVSFKFLSDVVRALADLAEVVRAMDARLIAATSRPPEATEVVDSSADSARGSPASGEALDPAGTGR